MTVAGLFRLIGRRWYVFAAGLLCAVAAILFLGTGQRLYSTQVEIVMLPPGTSLNFEMPDTMRVSLVNFADVTVREFNAQNPTHVLSAPKASLFGNGIRRGTSVQLANSGTQWSPSFGTPVISIQVIASSPEQVLSELNSSAAKIRKLTQQIQSATGAEPASFIEPDFDATRVNVYSFGPTRAGTLKANLALVAVSLCVSSLAADLLDRRLSKRRESPWLADTAKATDPDKVALR